MTLAVRYRGPWLAPFGMALGAWLIAGSLTELVERCQLGRVPVGAALQRLAGLPGAAWGTALAHAGVGIMVIGIVGVTAWREERIAVMKSGDVVSLAGLDVTYLGATPFTGPNYTAERGRFVVRQDGRDITTLNAEKREFQPGRQVTSEVGLHQFATGDLYIAMGEGRSDGGRAVRIYFNPLASLIWLGPLSCSSAGWCRSPTGATASGRRAGLSPLRLRPNERDGPEVAGSPLPADDLGRQRGRVHGPHPDPPRCRSV